MTIFFFSDISWEGLHQRPQHLARRMTKHYRVIWIEPIVLSKKPSFKIKEVAPNLFTISLPAFPYNARQKWIRYIIFPFSKIIITRWLLTKIQERILKKILNRLLISEKQCIFFYQNFHFINLTKYFKPILNVFDYIDNAFGFVKLPKHILSDWEYALKSVNFITVTSPTLKRQVEELRKTDVYLVSNGVEYDIFSEPVDTSPPPDLPTDKPIIGYVGAVYPWFNFDLLSYLCEGLPNLNFVIIGKDHPDIKNEIEKLKSYKNFYFLGFKDYKIIPKYLHNFSAAIIPFKKNILTEAVNPVKLYEYSAAGVPTICTNFSDDLIQFNDFIYIAKTNTEFKKYIELSINEKKETELKLKRFAQLNDWDEKYNSIQILMSEYSIN
jgi:glycosyltransferase involved in cell wall biosynthesis